MKEITDTRVIATAIHYLVFKMMTVVFQFIFYIR
jgi:hypothetical protein